MVVHIVFDMLRSSVIKDEIFIVCILFLVSDANVIYVRGCVFLLV